jgi:hypothetical protein
MWRVFFLWEYQLYLEQQRGTVYAFFQDETECYQKLELNHDELDCDPITFQNTEWRISPEAFCGLLYFWTLPLKYMPTVYPRKKEVKPTMPTTKLVSIMRRSLFGTGIPRGATAGNNRGKKRKADRIRSAVRPWVGLHAPACDAIPFDECSDEESCTRHVCLTQDAPKSSTNSRHERTEHAPPNTVE